MSIGRRALWHAPAALILGAACLSAAPQQPAFDSERALEHVRRLVAIGPRVAGTPGAERTRDYITKEIAALGLTAERQEFDAATPHGPAKMVNLRVAIPADASLEGPRLVIAGHYDTKLFRDFTFVGANDGGSSTAILLELARVLKGRQDPIPTELLFLDGEEAVVAWQGNDHTYGSRHYVQAAQKNRTLGGVRALILLDMIGDRDLQIKRESNSTPWLTDAIWNAAKRLKRTEFVDAEIAIEDDHVPFLQAGVPAVDLIDFDYPEWHQPGDTLDKVSGRSMHVVADVVVAALPEIMAQLSKDHR